MEEYEKSTSLWDEVFSDCELVDLTDSTLKVEPMFDACLQEFSKLCPRVLDYGCGSGDILFQCAEFGRLDYGLGIDRSEKGIEYANKMAFINHYQNLNFVVGDNTMIKEMDEEDFDGIILSNVLDVMPKEIAVATLNELTRLLKPGGYIFLKLNPYNTEHMMKEYGYHKLKDNLYEEDGVLRYREVTTKKWREEFEKDYTIERYLEFPYPWQEGLNRLFLLKKK